MSLVMGIDLGTSSTKTIILDQSGALIASASSGYGMETPRPDWVEQTPEDWWRAVCDTTNRAISNIPAPGTASDIKGVSLSGQMNGAVPVDRDGIPLRPAILWLDGRAQAECDVANQSAGDHLRAKALTVLNPVNTLAKILWLKANEPDCYGSASHVLIPKDWVRFRLTGLVHAEVSDASVSGAVDLYTRQWSADILDALEVPVAMFPPILESVDVAGNISSEAAGLTGLAVGTPVCAGGGDMACMAVGSGAIKPGVVGVGIGTAGHAISFASTVSEGAFNQLWPMCHSVPGAYFWLGCSYTGGGSLAWMSEQFAEDFGALTDQAATVGPGADGLFFMPWLAGTGTPNPDSFARGGWLGLSLQHTKAHMVRALMEGVAFDLRQALDCFARLGLPMAELRIGEGGAKSALWRQILVDVFGRDGRLMDLGDASAIGAAIIAGVGTGVFQDFEEGCGLTVRLADRIVCDSGNAGVYDSSYRLYQELYPSLKDWYVEAEGDSHKSPA